MIRPTRFEECLELGYRHKAVKLTGLMISECHVRGRTLDPETPKQERVPIKFRAVALLPRLPKL